MSDDFPYSDPKPQGAADFYLAIHATFRHIRDQFGLEGLYDYWADLGKDYQRPVWTRWSVGGLPAVADYWRSFFAREPGGVVEVEARPDAVVLQVRQCPAIKHLRDSGRQIMNEFCQHCAIMGDAAASQAALAVGVVGGNGTCTQTFTPRGKDAVVDVSAVADCGEEA